MATMQQKQMDMYNTFYAVYKHKKIFTSLALFPF